MPRQHQRQREGQNSTFCPKVSCTSRSWPSLPVSSTQIRARTTSLAAILLGLRSSRRPKLLHARLRLRLQALIHRQGLQRIGGSEIVKIWLRFFVFALARAVQRLRGIKMRKASSAESSVIPRRRSQDIPAYIPQSSSIHETRERLQSIPGLACRRPFALSTINRAPLDQRMGAIYPRSEYL